MGPETVGYGVLISACRRSRCPRRLARPRTSPFHGGNAGSNPAGDANHALPQILQDRKRFRIKEPTTRRTLVVMATR